MCRIFASDNDIDRINRSYGAPGILQFFNADGDFTGYISARATSTETTRRFSDISSNGLSKLRVALLLGCSTGLNMGQYNSLKTCYEKGAHFVLGTTKDVYTSDSDKFLEGFLDAIDVGYNVEEAINSGMEYVRTKIAYENDDINRFSIVYYGDSVQYLD